MKNALLMLFLLLLASATAMEEDTHRYAEYEHREILLILEDLASREELRIQLDEDGEGVLVHDGNEYALRVTQVVDSNPKLQIDTDGDGEIDDQRKKGFTFRVAQLEEVPVEVVVPEPDVEVAQEPVEELTPEPSVEPEPAEEVVPEAPIVQPEESEPSGFSRLLAWFRSLF